MTKIGSDIIYKDRRGTRMIHKQTGQKKGNKYKIIIIY